MSKSKAVLVRTMTRKDVCRHDILSDLRKKHKGLRRLGSGAFADVYGTKSGRTVFKIGATGNPIYDAYLSYVKQIVKHQGNPFFPRVKKVDIYYDREDHESVYVVEMERLKPLDTYGRSNKLPIASRLLFNALMDIDSESDLNTLHENMKLFTTVFARGVKKQLVQTFRQMTEILQDLTDSHGLDMHDGNVMLRGKTQLVITDPVC